MSRWSWSRFQSLIGTSWEWRSRLRESVREGQKAMCQRDWHFVLLLGSMSNLKGSYDCTDRPPLTTWFCSPWQSICGRSSPDRGSSWLIIWLANSSWTAWVYGGLASVRRQLAFGRSLAWVELSWHGSAGPRPLRFLYEFSTWLVNFGYEIYNNYKLSFVSHQQTKHLLLNI